MKIDERKQSDGEMLESVQKIFFGAPGTGKSYRVNNLTEKFIFSRERRKSLFASSDYCKKNYEGYLSTSIPKILDRDIYAIKNLDDLKIAYDELKKSDNYSADDYCSGLNSYIKFANDALVPRVFRTTFHPDYDYAQFVGAYKPKKEKDSITYSFVPQVFAKAYAAAWNNPSEPVYLVIEEINRGNCAQILGDIFQLLDRDENGYSAYEVDADADFAEWLKEQNVAGMPEKLMLPPNFNILATMNTSDQSLFPMDSAFKRRFDWEYVPIDYEKVEAKFEIAIGDSRYDWLTFIEKINALILDITMSEDKQLGEFFVKPDNGMVISEDRFKGKVLFYLWNEICKDEHKAGSFFYTQANADAKKEYFTFQDLYKKNGKELLKSFMDRIFNSPAENN